MATRPGEAGQTGGVGLVSLGILLLAVACFQLGAPLAKQLFPAVGPLGAATLRIGLSALLLCAMARPWRRRLDRTLIGPLLCYGLGLAGVISFFFMAVERIPLGIAIAIDFTGPLGVALLFSRRWPDLLCVALAALGIGLLLPLGGQVAHLDPVGVLMSFAAAICWGCYIVFGKQVGLALPSGEATALGLTVAAVAVLPFGIAQGGTNLVSLAVLPIAILMAVVASALPFRLEMLAMQRLPTRVFGVLMSLEPAFGALYGWVLLGEKLTVRQGLAVACVISASLASTLVASPKSDPG